VRGSHDAIREFSYTCIDSDRYDTQIPLECIRSYQRLAFNSADSEEPYKNGEFWDMGAGDHRQLLRLRIDARTAGLLGKSGCNHRAALREAGQVQELPRKIEYKLDEGAPRSWGIDAESWSAQMMAEFGAAGPFCLSATISEVRGEYDQAAASIASALKTPGLPAPAKRYLEGRLANVQAMHALQKSPWKPLFSAGTLDGWQTAKGKATVDTRRTVEARNALTPIMDEPVGEVFELRGEIELQKTNTYVAGGLAIGQPGIDRSDWVRSRRGVFNRDRRRVSF
jgi:hypothetical protein